MQAVIGLPFRLPFFMARSSAQNLKTSLLALREAGIGPRGQLEFSKRAGIGEGTVSRARRGDGNTTLESLDAMARIVKKEAWQLLVPGFDPEKPPALADPSAKGIPAAPIVEVFDVKISIAALELARAWEHLPPDRRLAYQQKIVAESLRHRADYVPDEKLGHLAAPTAQVKVGDATRSRKPRKPSSGGGTN